VRLVVDAPGGLPLVDADATALEQIVSNLLINALDAVGPGGTISVRAFVEDGAAVLRVADDGPGIAPENLGRIFDPFFTTKEVGKGTGLGLAVVFGLVNDMGGSVEAVNDSGAVFIVRLPLASAPEAGHEAA
jgi:signal transduction histidine kinase